MQDSCDALLSNFDLIKPIYYIVSITIYLIFIPADVVEEIEWYL